MVTVLLFASIAEAVGRRRLTVAVNDGDTVAAVRDRLAAEYPAMKPFMENLMYAVNEDYARPETPVADGATLALIPPVSGGSQ